MSTTTHPQRRPQCSFCEKVFSRDTPALRCSRCRSAWYCKADCQRRHWRAEHRSQCNPPAVTATNSTEGNTANARSSTLTQAPHKFLQDKEFVTRTFRDAFGVQGDATALQKRRRAAAEAGLAALRERGTAEISLRARKRPEALERLSIRQLAESSGDQIHHGKVLFVKIVSEETAVLAGSGDVMLLVEDVEICDEGFPASSYDTSVAESTTTGLGLRAWCAVANFSPPERFPAYLAICEPCQRFLDADLAQIVFVDNPGSIVSLLSVSEIYVLQNGLDILRYRCAMLGSHVEGLEAEGDAHLERNELNEANLFFSAALSRALEIVQASPKNEEVSHSVVRLLITRAECRYRADCFELARRDAQETLTTREAQLTARDRAKAVSVLCRALIGLRKFDLALKNARLFSELEYSGSHVDCPTPVDVERARRESEGDFDLGSLYNEARSLAKEIGGASTSSEWITLGCGPKLSQLRMDFFDPRLKFLRAGADNGRGVEARCDIAPGCLLVAERAIAVSSTMRAGPREGRQRSQNFNFDAKQTSFGDLTSCVIRAACGGSVRPKALLHLLSGGPSYPAEVEDFSFLTTFDDILEATESPSQSEFDPRRLQSIEWENSHHGQAWASAASRSIEDIGGLTQGMGGLWCLGSSFNHSCLPNVDWFVIGDFLFLATTRFIPAGSEVRTSYLDFRNSYQRRRETLANWRGQNSGFECKCERCSYAQSRPMYQQLEGEVERARTQTRRIILQANLSRGEAAGRSLPSANVVKKLYALREEPLQHRMPLAHLLRLMCFVHREEGDIRAEFKADSEAYEIESFFFGDCVWSAGPSQEDLVSCIRLASLSLHLGERDKAVDYVRRARKRNYTALATEDWIQLTGWGNHDFLREVLSRGTIA